MLLPGENSPKSWLLLTALVIAIITCIDSSEAKTIDFNIGFDLTQGKNGPSLHIRDFEDTHEFNPRANRDSGSSSESSGSASGSGSVEKKPSQAKHTSESGEPLRKHDSSKEADKDKAKSSESDSNDEDVNSKDTKGITRGLRGADFEPEEEKSKGHKKYPSGSNESGRR